MPAADLKRDLRVGYYQVDPRVVGSSVMELERSLSRIGKVAVTPIKELSAAQQKDFELLVIAGQTLDDESFPTWLTTLKRKVMQQGDIWVPVIILTDVSFQALESVWQTVANDNWYFDVVRPEHMSSLPIRVANLLRMADHLTELKSYEKMLTDLTDKVSLLESEVLTLRSKVRS